MRTWVLGFVGHEISFGHKKSPKIFPELSIELV
jgi:hypothetical protein